MLGARGDHAWSISGPVFPTLTAQCSLYIRPSSPLLPTLLHLISGYCIFLVVGQLPMCTADDTLRVAPIKHGTRAPPSSPNFFQPIDEDGNKNNIPTGR